MVLFGGFGMVFGFAICVFLFVMYLIPGGWVGGGCEFGCDGCLRWFVPGILGFVLQDAF